MRRTYLLLTLLAAVALGTVHVKLDEAPRSPIRVAVAPPPGTATPVSPASSAAPVEEVEPGDAEPILDKFIPRRSVGHAAGLNKV
ncbi:MAG: hypothetical protein ABIR26_07675, partial [Ramlibacter sp.]